MGFMTFLKGTYQEVLAYKAYLFDKEPKEKKKVIIFGQGRTGSTLLESLLQSTGQLKAHGELLDPSPQKITFPFAFIAGHSKRFQENFIFHCKIYHFSSDKRMLSIAASFLKNLISDGWTILYLKRENVVLQVLSNFISNERKSFHKRDDSEEEFNFTVDLIQFKKEVLKRLWYTENEIEALKNIPHMTITYEEALLPPDNHHGTVNKILAYANIKKGDSPNTKFRKVNTKKTEDIIINYDAFKKFVVAEGWGRYLD